MRTRTLLFGALLLLLPALPALATPPQTKVGVVDFTKIFDETEASRVDRTELLKLMADKQTLVDQRKKQLTERRAEFERVAEPKMDPVLRAKREAELDAAEGALRKLYEEAQAAVQKRERELSGAVVAEARALAPEVGRAHGVSVILGAAEALLWIAPEVVKVDLTGELARALDAKRRR